jgi:hypothetical protein
MRSICERIPLWQMSDNIDLLSLLGSLTSDRSKSEAPVLHQGHHTTSLILTLHAILPILALLFPSILPGYRQ